MAENNLPHTVRCKSTKPPYAERHVRWCGRSVNVKVGGKCLLWITFTSYPIVKTCTLWTLWMPSNISNKLYFSLCIETKKSKQPVCSCLLLNVLFENYSMRGISNEDVSNARYIQFEAYPMRGIPMRVRGMVLSKNAHPFSFKVGCKELRAHALV